MSHSDSIWSRRRLLSLAGCSLAGALASAGNSAQGAPEVANERHPHIHAAINSLKKAEHELKTANHDFGGHRVKAIESINHTLGQLEACLKADKR